jgi:ATP-dependent Clp protease, protease subunit
MTDRDFRTRQDGIVTVERCGCSDTDSDKESFVLRRLLASRTLVLAGAVDSRLSQRIANQLLLLESDDPDAPITMIMNSPGGSVSDGFLVYDMIRFVKPRIRILCTGLAASIATIILLAPAKEDRLSLPNTRFMIHQPLIPMSVYGPASDLEITANEILKTREKINRILAEGTGQTFERVSQDTQRDYWLDASQAVEYGLVDRVVGSRAELDVSADR